MNRIAFAAFLVAACCGQRELGAHPSLELQIRQLDREISTAPQRADLFLRRAELFRLHHQFIEALRDLDAAAQLANGTASYAFQRARLYLDMGRNVDALRLMEGHLAQRCPAEPDAYMLLARIQRALGRLGDSIEAHQLALLLSARPSPDDYVELASNQRSLGNSDAALQTLDRGMSKLGAIVSLQSVAIEIEIEARNFESALKRIDHLKRAGMPEEAVLVKRAQVLLKVGRIEEAAQTYGQARNMILAQVAERGATPSDRKLLEEIDRLLAADSPQTTERRP